MRRKSNKDKSNDGEAAPSSFRKMSARIGRHKAKPSGTVDLRSDDLQSDDTSKPAMSPAHPPEPAVAYTQNRLEPVAPPEEEKVCAALDEVSLSTADVSLDLDEPIADASLELKEPDSSSSRDQTEADIAKQPDANTGLPPENAHAPNEQAPVQKKKSKIVLESTLQRQALLQMKQNTAAPEDAEDLAIMMLRHCNWDVSAATALYDNHMQWKQQLAVHSLRIDHEGVAEELKKGYLILLPGARDKMGRPILFVNGWHDGSSTPAQLFTLMLYYFETAGMAYCPEGVLVVINIRGPYMRPPGVADRLANKSLAKHYSWVNYTVILMNCPTILVPAFKALFRFMDANVDVHVSKDEDYTAIEKFVDADNRMIQWGGDFFYVSSEHAGHRLEQDAGMPMEENAQSLRNLFVSQVTNSMKAADFAGAVQQIDGGRVAWLDLLSSDGMLGFRKAAWKAHFFVLLPPATLIVFKNDTNSAPLKIIELQSAVLDIADAGTVKAGDGPKSHSFVISSAQDSHHIAAATAEEKEQWLAALAHLGLHRT